MSVDVCSVENEAEGEAIRQLLEDHGIDAQLVQQQSSVYPGQLLHPNWGTIRVAEADVERARELVKEWERAGPGGDE